MNKTFLILLTVTGTFLFSYQTFAQLAMSLELNSKNYISYEKIYARLTIKNQSGQALIFGSNKKLQGKISFKIETIQGEPPVKLEKPQFEIRDILLKAGDKHTFNIPITKYFEFPSNGKYRIRAVVSHTLLPKNYLTEPVEFNIVKGNTIWKTSVGVPLSGTDKIDLRKYNIISYFDGKYKIFCLLIDDDKHIYGLTKIGYDIGTIKPECQIDRLSKLHILVQNSTDIFSYFIYDVNCTLEQKEVYKRLDEYTIPHLLKDDGTGRLNVVGGTIAIKEEDYFEHNE